MTIRASAFQLELDSAKFRRDITAPIRTSHARKSAQTSPQKVLDMFKTLEMFMNSRQAR